MITVISMVGVAAGVMALVIALAINNGFRNTLQRSLLGATAHVMILEQRSRSTGSPTGSELDPQLLPHPARRQRGARSFTASVLASGPVQTPPAVLKGIHAQCERRPATCCGTSKKVRSTA